MRRVVLAVVLSLMIGLCLPTSTMQPVSAWSTDPTVNTLLCEGGYWGAAMAADGSGGAIVAWSESEGNGDPRLHARGLDETGSRQWTQEAVCTAKGWQFAPVVTGDGSGGAILAWRGSYGICAQKLNKSGKRQWASNGVAVAGADFSMVTGDGYGGAIVIWQHSGDLYAQRLDADGALQWGADGIGVYMGGQQWLHPVMVGDGEGGVIIAWYDGFGGSGGLDSVYAQRVDAHGVPLWTENGKAICPVSSDQRALAIASDGSGGAVIAWDDGRSPDGGVYAQRLNSGGELQWAPEGVFVCPAVHKKTRPVMASDGSGGVIITLDSGSSASDGENSDIYAQRLDSAGVLQWAPGGLVVCAAVNNQVEPAVVSDGSGGAVIAWQDGRSSEATDIQDRLWEDEANVSHNDDIYAQKVDSSGTPQWAADGVPVCTASHLQRHLQMVGDGSGGAIVTWTDYRAYPLEGMRADVALMYDVYVQRLDGSGVLGPATSNGGSLPWVWIVIPLGAVIVVGAGIAIWRSRRAPPEPAQTPPQQ